MHRMSNLHDSVSQKTSLKAKFDPNAPPSTMLPRQDYGIDFYGVQDGEIMVIVDLFYERNDTHASKQKDSRQRSADIANAYHI